MTFNGVLAMHRYCDLIFKKLTHDVSGVIGICDLRWPLPWAFGHRGNDKCMLASRLRANGHDSTWHLEKEKTHSWHTSWLKRAIGSPCILHRSCDMGKSIRPLENDRWLRSRERSM